MCNPLFDIQAEVSDSVLELFGLNKGGMHLVQHEQQRQIIPHVYERIVNTEAGGSGANTMIGMAQLGAKVVYAGHIGDDDHGRKYREGLEAKGVKPNLGESEGLTGVCLVLITPDAERTMCTYLGNCLQLHRDNLDLDALRSSRYLYVTGYLWDTKTQKKTVLHAMEEANAAGVKVALSLADPFCVDRHRDDFLDLINNHVSLVIGNKAEAIAMTGEADAHAAAHALKTRCAAVSITMDRRGSLLLTDDGLVEVDAYPQERIDATGAGDMYAAGLLYGLTQDFPPTITARIASYLASKTVGHLGPRLPEVDQESVAMLAGGASFDDVVSRESGLS